MLLGGVVCVCFLMLDAVSWGAGTKEIFVTVPVYTLLKCVLCVCTHVLTFSYKYWLPSYPLQYEMFRDAANSSKAGNFLIIISCNGNMFS